MRTPALEAALAKVGITPCGDHGCMFGAPRGMATNGGCSCLDGAPGPLVLRRLIMKLAMVARDLAGHADVTAVDRFSTEELAAVFPPHGATPTRRQLDAARHEQETLQLAINLVAAWGAGADDTQIEHDFCDAVRQLPGWKDEPC